ncbi:PIR Superfamily Protein [Plasmodium ovale curtisi]|uniref:PIR Superfamily Protein n=1 Tax=Plasmodium ovale curtisi TaxID=864141 RepID=A0A1A8WK35_PLAOA|nr:PIR Superfamily Protein [Plasmodium ovale curtisi]
MTSKIVTGTYTFWTNSNYYEAFVKHVKDKCCDVEKKDSCEGEKKDSCEVGKKDSCKELSTSMTFSNNLHGKDICQEFKLLYKLLRDNSVEETTVNAIFSENDCNFLNYWLNNILRKNVINGSINVKGFYEEIKRKDDEFFSKHDLGKYMNVIDPEILENMKILYELYHYKQKILDIMLKQDYSDNGELLCPQYTKECHEKYIEGIDKCINDYDDFYKALKEFKNEYKYGIEEVTDESGYCSISKHFRLPEYDSVLEKKQKKFMLIQNITTPLIMLFIIPLLYKYTPFGPFLRTKINMVKDKWMNADKNESELLSISTDTEDNISENGEYNIGYYSGTN